jgi:hypothetical protein
MSYAARSRTRPQRARERSRRVYHAVAFLLTLVVSFASPGCSVLERGASEFLGGNDAAWREQDLVGPRSSDELSEREIDRRLSFLEQRLGDGRLRAESWQLGWLLINTSGTVLSSVQSVFDDGNSQVFDIIEAVKGGIGVGYMFVPPLPAWHGATPILEMPGDTRREKLAQLRRAEELLLEAAEHARRRKSWVIHLGNVGVNLVGAAALLGLGSPTLAALSFGIDTTVGEAQIWSRPWAPEEEWEEYVHMVETGGISTGGPSTRWSVVPTARGLALVAHF